MNRVRNNEKSKKVSLKKVILLIIQLILLVIIIYTCSKIFKWFMENTNNNKIIEDISEAIIVDEEKEDIIIDFEELKKYNSDSIAWIKVNETNIEYPVVKATNNDYYLKHSLDKSYNSAGWIFADYKNKFDGTDKNIVIYGHNRKDGSMFGTLKNILDENWYSKEENLQIKFSTEKENCTYQIFSIYKIEEEDYYITTYFNNNFEEFLNVIKKRSIKNFGIELNENDQILTLSTCDNSNKYRVVLHAKKI